MEKEIISDRQAICVISLFILADSVFGLNPAAKQDTWLSILAAFLLFGPILLTWARMVSLYPGKNLADIIVLVFGRIAGKIIVFLYVYYAIFLGGAMLRILIDFISVSSLPETPKELFLVFFLIFCAWMVKSGVEPLGRWSGIVLTFFVISPVLTFLTGLNSMNFGYLAPIGGAGFKNIMDTAFSAYSYPLAESIMFLFLFRSVQTTSKPKKILFWGTGVAVLIMVVITIRNFALLGASTTMFFYPSYAAASTIKIGAFFSRFEVLIGMDYVIAVLVKISVCMFAAAICSAKLLNLKDYRPAAYPIGLLMITHAMWFFTNTVQNLDWAGIYRYYALIFHTILPLILWVGCEVKNIAKKIEAMKAS